MVSVAILAAALPQSGGAAAFTISNTAERVFVSAEGRAVLTYRQTPNPNKVYVAELHSPSGVQVLLDSPPDHVHHHGLMYAIDAGPDVFWMDGGKGAGMQKPKGSARDVEGRAGGIATLMLEQPIEWIAQNGTNLLEEARTVTVFEPGGLPATLLTWSTKLTPAPGRERVDLATDRSYAGLGFRFPKSMDGKARFLFPEGTNTVAVRNTEKVTSDRWCACVGPVGDKIVTVAMLSHPGNPRHPTNWFTMSDSLTYMTATLNLYRQPLSLPAGQTLALVYGVAVWDGEADPASIEALYRQWLKITAAPTPFHEEAKP
jgi:hypothetical protein